MATSVEIEAFKTERLTFLTTTTQKIFERSPLGSTIVCYASSLNPTNLNHPPTPALFKSLISRLVYLKILQPKLVEKALSQFTSFIENCVKKILKMYHHLIEMNKREMIFILIK